MPFIVVFVKIQKRTKDLTKLLAFPFLKNLSVFIKYIC